MQVTNPRSFLCWRWRSRPKARIARRRHTRWGNVAKKLADVVLRDRVQAHAVMASADPDGDTRWAAHFVLQALEAPPTVRLAVIERGLRDPVERVKEIALRGLKELEPEVDLQLLLPLIAALARSDGSVGGSAIDLLREAGPRAVDATGVLKEIAGNPDGMSVRAAQALWRITRDPAEVLPVLEREFERDGEQVCGLICELGPAAAPLLPRILEALADDSSYDLQWAAADALGAVASADPEVVEALGRALDHPSGIVRSAAAQALGNTGPVAVPLLLKHLAPPFSPCGEFAADALSRMGPTASSAVDALRIAHRDGAWGLRAWAAIALARIAADPTVVPDLIKILESDDDSGPTLHAIEALAAIGPSAKKALPALNRLREHWNEEFVAAAEAALAAIAARAS